MPLLEMADELTIEPFGSIATSSGKNRPCFAQVARSQFQSLADRDEPLVIFAAWSKSTTPCLRKSKKIKGEIVSEISFVFFDISPPTAGSLKNWVKKPEVNQTGTTKSLSGQVYGYEIGELNTPAASIFIMGNTDKQLGKLALIGGPAINFFCTKQIQYPDHQTCQKLKKRPSYRNLGK